MAGLAEAAGMAGKVLQAGCVTAGFCSCCRSESSSSALLVFYFYVYSGAGYFPGEIILILLVVLVVLFVVRMLFWRARRKYMRGPLDAEQNTLICDKEKLWG